MTKIKGQEKDESDSKVQVESDVDMEEEELQLDVAAEDDEDEMDEDDEDEEGGAGNTWAEDADDDEPAAPSAIQPRLKIKLKLSNKVIASSSNSRGSPSPEDDVDVSPQKSRTRKPRPRITDIDIESEDPTSQSESEDVDSGLQSASRSTGTPSAGTKPMTTRQAVLASVVDSTHVSLNDGSRSKKRTLNESELALRREETARKRKNLTEKKLEDEKAETINRLLKKQSRPKNKRTVTNDDRSPMPTVSKLKAKAKASQDAEDEEDEDEVMEEVLEEVAPVMYRWVSSSRNSGDASAERKMTITLSVPIAVNSRPISTEADLTLTKNRDQGPAMCAVEGCTQSRKYRLVKDWTRGACGLGHMRILEAQS